MHKTKSKRPAQRGKSGKAPYVSRHRQKQKRRGLRRLEIAVRPKDIPVIKSIVSTLHADGAEAERLRQNAQAKTSFRKAKTGAEFYAMLRQFVPLGDEVSFERDNIQRPFFSFEST